MKVLIIHSCHLHGDFYNRICAMVGIYSLTGSVSSSSGVVPPQLLSQELLISPWCHELKFPGSWNVVAQYMVHHHMETEIEWWQIVSSLVHSSLVVCCSYRLKFLKDSFLSNCCLLSIVGLDHEQSPWWQTLTPFPAAPRINSTTIDISLRIYGSLLLYIIR